MTKIPTSTRSVRIEEAQAPEDVAAVRQLFRDYALWLNVDLHFQDFDGEMARFPKGYDRILLARADGAPAGAVGLRSLAPGICEMKRLYVPDRFRGLGLGRALCVRLLDEARGLGYRAMRLDTLDRLTEALSLYRSLGFAVCPAYYDNPLEGVVYLEKAL
ncbi:MAG: GNAT family N-acetyltransferase [Alphaproteobacteria bacterium]